MSFITVMGATGHTGSNIAQRLLQSGAKVRALGRDRARLGALADAGAEVRAGDATDPGFLAEAFAGSDAVYTLLATDRRAADYAGRQAQEGEAIARAVRDSGVSHVVALSSLGAELAAGTGVIAGLHAQEERLQRTTQAHLLFLRPVSFFENFLEAIEPIRQSGVLADTVDADLPVPMIAARDIAEVAAKALMARDWQGVAVRELLGERDLSHVDVARLIGARIGQPELPYVQISEVDMVATLVDAGLSHSFATLYVEMTRAFNEGRVRPREGRHAGNTTSTRFEDFVDELSATAL